jgi:AraC-like DNA-binding protein
MRSLDPLFTFRLTPIVLRLARVSPAQGHALLLRCGLPESAAEGVLTAPLSRIRRLLQEAALLVHGNLGVALAKATPEGTYETAELLVRTAPTLTQGFEALSRYASLINPVGLFETRITPTHVELHYEVLGSPQTLGAHLNEFTIAHIIEALRRVADSSLKPAHVWFSHPVTSDLDALGAHFGAPIQLGAITCGLSFPRDFASASLRTKDEIVHAFLIKQAEAKLEAAGARSFAAIVIDCIESRVGFAKADLVSVCEALGITVRTAQRRFREEGTSFREVLDEARMRQSASMIRNGMPVESIAEGLGFADVRSFRRAAKRWEEQGSHARVDLP